MIEALKAQVRERAQDRREYRRMPQTSDFMDFEFDHIIAQKHKGLDDLGQSRPGLLPLQ
jgi:hypothetical protein